MDEDKQKLKEKALLLLRFYWRDELYRIGKELNLPYFYGVKDYWEIDDFQSSLEVSKAITDEDLIKLTRENPPKYGLSLGGFQGKNYTATEKGEVKFVSSWKDVIKIQFS